MHAVRPAMPSTLEDDKAWSSGEQLLVINPRPAGRDREPRLADTMPRPRFSNLPFDKRQRILEAAAYEFAGHGFNGASPDEFRHAFAYLSELIGHGQRIGAIRGDVPAAFLVAVVGAAFEAADRWSVAHAEEMGPAALDQLGVTLFDMIERFVAPPTEKDGPR